LKLNDRYYAKKSFSDLIRSGFIPRFDDNFNVTKIDFKENCYYYCDNENENFIIINNVVFRKSQDAYFFDIKYLYDFFYTKEELRKIKLDKLNDYEE